MHTSESEHLLGLKKWYPVRTPASIYKNTIPPMLIASNRTVDFSLVCDSIRLTGASAEIWSAVAFITLIGDLISVPGAAVPGTIDLLYSKGGTSPVKQIALTHMAINLTAVML